MRTLKQHAKEFKVVEVQAVETRYNIDPTQGVLVIYESGDKREAALF